LNNANTSVYIAVKNVKFYATSDEIIWKFIEEPKAKGIIKQWRLWGGRMYIPSFIGPTNNTRSVKREYTASNYINGPEYSYDTIIGDVNDTNIDNVIEQFNGAIVVSPAMVPSVNWNTRQQGILMNAENKAINQIAADELRVQFSRPKDLLSLPIIEENINPEQTLNILGNIQDTMNVIQGKGGNLITGWLNHPYGYGTYPFYSYDTFQSVGTTITYATGINGRFCDALETFPVISGEIIKVLFNIIFTGVAPWIEIAVGTNTFIAVSNPGFNEQTLTMTVTGTASVQIKSFGTTSFSISSICICRDMKKFAFNSGTFNVRDREWQIDLTEII
jgi:hypothetical protein